jgi:hypothetical protein
LKAQIAVPLDRPRPEDSPWFLVFGLLGILGFWAFGNSGLLGFLGVVRYARKISSTVAGLQEHI